MKNFLAKIIALWAALVFIITLIPASFLLWIIGVIKEPRRTKVFRIISQVWMRLFFILTGCGLRVVGKKNFKAGENYIITCNHNSFMDVPLATPFIPGANKTIAKEEMSKIPLFGLVYKRGSVLVNRENKDSRRDSFRKMKEVLHLGMHMCIYPEGTRNKTDIPIKEFHDGAFKLAIETKKAIIPALMFNTKKVLPPGKLFYFWPAALSIHFLPPVAIDPNENFEELKIKIHRIMTEYYVENAKI